MKLFALLACVFSLTVFAVETRAEGTNAVAATIGLAATGTVYGVLAGGLRARETLVPLLVLPAVTPVMLGATRAFQAALDGSPGDAWPWVQLLMAFAGLVAAAGTVAFGPLLEEA